MKIAITTSSFAQYSKEPLELLERAGLEYVLNPHGRKLTEDEVSAILDGCVGIVAGTEHLTEKVIASSTLKVISRCGVGLDSVDMKYAEGRGIPVFITPHGPTLAVAELTLGLVLNLLRQVGTMDRELRNYVWKKRMGQTLAGKNLGVIGFGRIGKAVADIFAPLGVAIAYSDPCVVRDSYRKMELDDLLSWADIITLHCSQPECGCTLLAKKDLGLMKPGSWLVNCGRGGLVDEKALYDALKSDHLGGAAIDVFEKEPYRGPLTTLDNVMLTPHIGSYARETRVQMEIDAVKNLLAGLGFETDGTE